MTSTANRRTIAESDVNARQPTRRSPLQSVHEALDATFEERAGWQVPAVYTSVEEEVAAVRARVGVADLSMAGVLRVKGRHAHEALEAAFDTAPESVGDAVTVDAVADRDTVARPTDDEFLIVTEPCTHRELEAVQSKIVNRKSKIDFVTIVDQTAGLAGLLVAGPMSRAVLGKLCALSLHPEAFPNGHVAQSSVAKVHAVIVRNDVAQVPAFELYVERPYALYVWESVLDAGREFDVAPIGWRARAMLRSER